MSERLYNIYYLLRRDSGSSQAVEALIDFMACFYTPLRTAGRGSGNLL